MKILAIDTSCDDTSIAIADFSQKKSSFSFSLLANIVSSQVEIHKKWGGVYPTLAKREHQKNLTPVLTKTLKKAKLLKKRKEIKEINAKKIKKIKKFLEREPELAEELIFFLKNYQKPKIESIAVTIGPGLDPCLWTGINFSKAIAYFWNLPVIPVNHLQGHIFSAFLGRNISKLQTLISNPNKLLPAICLIVSGGHTQLILMEKIGKYKLIGETRDDAAGECFDKTARILGLSYPGGPAIAIEAKKYCPTKNSIEISLPRPMIKQNNYDFSFSGLKTAVLYNFKKQPLKIRKSKKYVQIMAKEIQQTIIDILIKKTIEAAKNSQAKSVIIGGGVTANKELRLQFKKILKKEKINFILPETKFSTDNAAMIALAACFQKQKTKDYQKIKSEPNLTFNQESNNKNF